MFPWCLELPHLAALDAVIPLSGSTPPGKITASGCLFLFSPIPALKASFRLDGAK